MENKTKSHEWPSWASPWNPKAIQLAIALGEGTALVYSSIVLDGHKPDDPLFYFSITRGLMGVATSFAAAYATNELPKRGKLARALGWTAIVILLVSGVVVMATCANGSPSGIARDAAALGFALLPASAAVAVSLASGHLFADDQRVKPTGGTGQQTGGAKKKPVKQTGQQTQPVAAPAQPVAPTAAPAAATPKSKMSQQVTCPHCQTTGSQGWLNSHEWRCTQNPNSKKYKPQPTP